MTDDNKIKEAMEWSEDRLEQEEAKISAIEPVKYKPQKLNFVVGGQEKTPSAEQQGRIDAIMKPLDNISFSWSPEQMKAIVKNGLEDKQKVLENIGANNDKQVESLKRELSSLIKETITLGTRIASGQHITSERQTFTTNMATIDSLKKELDDALNHSFNKMCDKIGSEFTQKHEDNEEIDIQVPKMLKAKEIYEEKEKQRAEQMAKKIERFKAAAKTK